MLSAHALTGLRHCPGQLSKTAAFALTWEVGTSVYGDVISEVFTHSLEAEEAVLEEVFRFFTQVKVLY